MRVVLLSGGLDSTVCLWLAAAQGNVVALSVDYGQRAAESERRHSADLAGRVGAAHRHLAIPAFGRLAESALTTGGDLAYAPSTVVPGRNAVLLSLAATLSPDEIWIGCNGGDSLVYADCRPEFLVAAQAVIRLGACTGTTIRAPLLGMTKADVLRHALNLGVPVAATSNCYAGTGCKVCAACKVRAAAFAEVGA